MQTSFFFAVLPPPSKSSATLKSTFERLKAVDEGERSFKFLLKNEFLHRFNLLHSSRSIISRSISATPNPQVDMPHAPASMEEPTSSESHGETVLKKCTSPSGDVEPSNIVPLSPIIEEDIPQRPGKEHIEPEKQPEDEETIVEGEQNVQEADFELQEAGHDSDGAHIFGNLSDIMINPSEFFKDHTSHPSLPGIETSPTLPPLLPAKELSSVTKAITPAKSKSGSLHNACSLHFTHT